jgi:hypothetical protein
MDLDAWLDTFAADAVDHDPVGTPPVVGHQGLRQFFQTITATGAGDGDGGRCHSGFLKP